MLHHLQFKAMSKLIPDAVIKSVGVSPDPSLSPVNLTPVRPGVSSTESRTNEIGVMLQKQRREKKEAQAAADEFALKYRQLEAESRAAIARQLKEREDIDSKVDATKSDQGESASVPDAVEAQVQASKLVATAQAFVDGNLTVVQEMTIAREAGKSVVAKLDQENSEMRKQMAAMASQHNWAGYWDANVSLTQQLGTRNKALHELKQQDMYMISARKNLSIAQGEQDKARAVLSAARNQAVEAASDAHKQAAARRQTKLLKQADEASARALVLQDKLRVHQAVAPPAGLSMAEHKSWSQAHASKLQTLSSSINQAIQDAATASAQASAVVA